MKKLQVILVMILLITSFTTIIFPLVGATSYTYKEVQFGDYKYDYYSSAPVNDWVILFLPGGIGYGNQIDGCLGQFDAKTNLCVPNPRGDEWLSKMFTDNGIDFMEAQSYTYKLSDTWVLFMLTHLKDDLKYKHVLLSGFSGGGGVTASMPTVFSNLRNVVDACIIYEGPTSMSLGGPMGSSEKAHYSLTKTFLAYGINDTTVKPENGSKYAAAMPYNIEKLLVTLPFKHDITIIVYSLDTMFSFIGKPRPPQYTVKTSIISFTTESTKTETLFKITTATTTATTLTELITTTQTRVVKTFMPNWESIRNAIIVIFWFVALILSVWFIRSRRMAKFSWSKPYFGLVENNDNRKSKSGRH